MKLIFDLMATNYPKRWTSMFGSSTKATQMATQWRRGLESISRSTLRHAYKLIRNHPNECQELVDVDKFKQFCEQDLTAKEQNIVLKNQQYADPIRKIFNQKYRQVCSLIEQRQQNGETIKDICIDLLKHPGVINYE